MRTFRLYLGFYRLLEWLGWYEKIEEYCPNKKNKIFLAFDNMIADIYCLAIKNFNK